MSSNNDDASAINRLTGSIAGRIKSAGEKPFSTVTKAPGIENEIIIWQI